MLKVGDDVPSLEGLPITPGRPAVLFFFPKADTPVCTAEACAFRDNAASLQRQADVIGLSRDDEATLAKFAEKHDLGYPLVSDSGGRWAKAFGVAALGGLLPFTWRATFVVRDGKVVGAYRNDLAAEAHVRAAREALSLES